MEFTSPYLIFYTISIWSLESANASTDAPAAIGPYTQAFKVGDLLFVSGSIPLDPKTGQIVPGGVEAQTEQALKNMKAIVEAAGSDLGKIVKTLVGFRLDVSAVIWVSAIQVFIKNMDDFGTINVIYEKFFGNHKPARSAVEVARLPKDVLFEIECIARCASSISVDLKTMELRWLGPSLKD
jgi:2-iminobutanoate/2-iminopropanoate deaminase